jgi:glycosyltransferase involved in cell wall biosynthesis
VDLWQAEWTPYAECLCRAIRGPWVVMAHNVESLIWRRYFETETGRLKRWYINRQWRKFERFERRIFSRSERTIAVSDADSHLARTQLGATRLSVVENGVDAASYCFDGRVRDPNQILFLGSLDWRPNQDAVVLLLDRIFPDVLRELPSARLVVVGRKPPRWLVERAARCPHLDLCADVPDVRPFLWQCGVMAVPLRIGGGSRLKILEALAAECPVVSTKVGAEGLCLDPGRHFVEVESPDRMASRLVECLRSPGPFREMAGLGRQVVAAKYDWSVLAEKLDAVWREHGAKA